MAAQPGGQGGLEEEGDDEDDDGNECQADLRTLAG